MSEIKEIPKHWQIKKLGDVCDKITKGGTPTTYGFAFVSSGVNFIKIENVEHGKVNLSTIKTFITEEAHNYQRKSMLEENDLLFSIAGTIGETCLIKREYLPANTNQALAILRGYIKTFKPQFLTYQLSSSISQYVKLKARGGAMNNISLEDLKGIELAVPPLPEQQAIVAKIEELLSELENGKQQLLTAQQQLKVYRQSLLKWAFEGKLTNKKVKDGELPKGWKWVKNKELLKYVTSGSRDWKQYYSNKGSRFVRTQDINSNKLDLANAAYMDLPEKVEGKRSLIEEGDILMTITGANVGKVAVVDFPIEDAYVSQSVALLKYQDKRITKFLWYFFQAQGFGKSFIDKLVYGVGRPVLSLENMREVDVISCPIEDQQEIINELESKLTVCDKIEETISQSLQQAETLRQSILKQAFEGKLININS